MSQSPLEAEGSKDYADAWRAINILIRGDGSWSGRERNLCFRNLGNGQFADISFLSGLDLDSDGRAFVPIDLDADGDQDLILKNRNGHQLRAFRNDMPDGPARHLSLRLEGRRSNRDGVGGRVWVGTDRRTLMREIVSGSGYLSQRSRVAWFGLGPEETVRSIRVRWPLGLVQEFGSPPQGGNVLLVEGEPGFRERPRPPSPPNWSESAALPERARSPGTWLAEALPAPDFALPVVGRAPETVRLSQRRGHPVLLNFWATWCPPCRQELVRFQERLAGLTSLRVELLAVSLDEPGNAGAVRQLAEDLGLEYTVLLADAQTAEAYSVLNERLFDRRRSLAIPTSFLLDGQGQIVKVYRGVVEVSAVLRDIRAGNGEALPFDGRWAESGPRRDFEELASAFAERGLASAARGMFDEALARGARSPMLLNNLAGILISDGENERGEQLLREALANEPNLIDAKVNLASLLVQRGALSEGEALLQEALDAQPRDAQALSALGSVHFARGQLEDAEALFRRAAAVRPDDARFRENLGAVLASMGRFEEALIEYEWARDSGAGGAPLFTNLGVLYAQTGRMPDALESFRQAADADRLTPGPQLNLARLHLQMNDAAQAMRAIQRAKELAPGNLQALLMESQALASQGRLDEARASAREALRHHPDSVDAADLLNSLR